uniref:Pectinesterase inhibitor domain-containing protein n=1 Tax=Oryza punctata TaxID=4537 RepID=A0A0E0MDC4_ORYPU
MALLLFVPLLLVAGSGVVSEAAEQDVPASIVGPCSRTGDKKSCVEFLSAIPEARKATTVAPLAELYLRAIANLTTEAKAMATKLLASKKGKGVPPVCLEQCTASVDTLSNALAAFFSSSGDDANKKYRDMDGFLVGFLRTPMARKQPPICMSACPIRSCDMDEVSIADKFHQAWKMLGIADGLITQIITPAVRDKGTKS